MRHIFEKLCVERMSEWRGAGNTLNDNGSPLTVESLCWKDENGNYGVLALNAAWWGFRMGLESKPIDPPLTLEQAYVHDTVRKLVDALEMYVAQDRQTWKLRYRNAVAALALFEEMKK